MNTLTLFSMLRSLYFLLPRLYYSFPVQLLLNNFRRNIVLMICWIILFAMITGNLGKNLGIPYLFLDPEYLNKVSFTGFFIMGATMAGFANAFHITCYLNDSLRFSFVGTLPKPFTLFKLNNSAIPLAFLATYVYEVIRFQLNNEFSDAALLAVHIGGLMCGYGVMTLLFTLYFWFTNKDIFKYVVCRIDERLKEQMRLTRATALKNLHRVQKKQVRVDRYVDLSLRMRPVEPTRFYNKSTVLQVFNQNHLNLVLIEVAIFLLVLALGIFKDVPLFQLPAAASFIIFLTIFVMAVGACTYWFGGWSATAGIILFLVLNHLAGQDFFTKRYEAFGLNYQQPPAAYSVAALQVMTDPARMADDRQRSLTVLQNWRSGFGDEKPLLTFICVSGGGKRAALWALTCLQEADSLTGGAMMKNAVLITGASGGLIGATYFRELLIQNAQGAPTHPFAHRHRSRIASDNLNPMIFSLLANDLFVGFTRFPYGGNHYHRDRAYTFEEQLNLMTSGFLDKPLEAYDSIESSGRFPTILFTPTIVNDGRKLLIASRPMSFMNAEAEALRPYGHVKISNVDFHHLFAEHGSRQLRFLSALRMSATFPYITPNTTLPTEPPIQIMDAGISDNFGLSDAVRFLFAFRDWVDENTRGVLFVSIRDSPKLGAVGAKKGESIINSLTQPISSVYNNFENFQDMTADLLTGHAAQWLKAPIHRIDLEYEAERYNPAWGMTDSLQNGRASLSWRLTTREKMGVVENIRSDKNKKELSKLQQLLERQ
jgi:hypothetical protein